MRVAVYLRQSFDREGTGLAVDRQRQDCLKLCAERGWEPVEYVDNSISATSRKPRPAYLRMLDDIRAGVVRGVVVWDLDRLHRQPAELESFIDLADQHRLALATVTGDTDLGTDNGRLFARIKGAVARSEIERKSERQKAAHRQRAAAGKPYSPVRPFGFLEDLVTHHPTEAAAIRGMYDDALAGVSQSAIARGLNECEIPSATGAAWTQASVRNLLLKSRNAGLLTYKGEIVGPGAWDPIVPLETYRAVVEKFTANPRPFGARGGPRKHLLVGVAFCGVCGAALTTGYTKATRRIYTCPIGHVSRKAEAVEELVEAVVVARLSRTDAIDLLSPEDDDEAEQLARERQAAADALDTLAQMFAGGELTASAFRAGNDKARARLEAADAAIPHTATTSILKPLVAADDVAAAWAALGVPRRRAALEALMTVTLLRTRRGERTLDPESVEIAWDGGGRDRTSVLRPRAARGVARGERRR